jgi:hypothetical protein
MMVHESQEVEFISKGYVVVERNGVMVTLALPSETCLREMRGDRKCIMDKNHRGRCASVAFFCDACGKMRRGTPTGHSYDSNDDPTTDYCWFCVNVGER